MSRQQTRFDPRSIARLIVQLILLAAILFLSAGTIRWTMGWVVIGLYTIVMLATICFVQVDREFLAQRTKVDSETKGWDKIIAGMLRFISPIGIFVVAGIEFRFGSSWELSASIRILSLLVTILGYGVGIWATSSNPFYAGYVRIDGEQGVVCAGPYAHIRHPGYAGSILVQISLPIALGSMWALFLGILGVVLVVVRTHLEDRMLIRELPGYDQYAQRVRFRLLPRIY
jgi:protein-S-isoprenylcysteine O-methyltransferase Ste14